MYEKRFRAVENDRSKSISIYCVPSYFILTWILLLIFGFLDYSKGGTNFYQKHCEIISKYESLPKYRKMLWISSCHRILGDKLMKMTLSFWILMFIWKLPLINIRDLTRLTNIYSILWPAISPFNFQWNIIYQLSMQSGNII